MSKIFTVSILGCGNRGRNAYGKEIFAHKDKFKIVSICDNNKTMLDIAKSEWDIDDENCFLNEDEFFAKKRSDALVIATQDRDHVRECIKALELGYDVLLEKPISPIESDLYKLLEVQKKYGGKVVVCHVLRYSPSFIKLKEIIDSGKIGRIVSIDWIEQVAYWHQAHSFVRGHWRNDTQTSPMIMQKCCHDLDLIQYYVNSKCDTVYSVGNLSFFNKENKPKDAADFCKDCKYINTCPYSAERVYVELKHKWKVKDSWPFNVVDLSKPITDESLRKAYENNQYGKCVFNCDNNVVDNQMVLMQFNNGIKVNLNMTAFTAYPGRKMTFHGTLGEIEMDEFRDYIRVTVYGEQTTKYNKKKYQTYSLKKILKSMIKDSYGHGGGDQMLVRDFYKSLNGEIELGTTLENSVESHLIALCAEKSRLDGKIYKVHENK